MEKQIVDKIEKWSGFLKSNGLLWTSQLAAKAIKTKVFGAPKKSKLDQSILVETTTYCNLKCPMCVRTIQVENGTWRPRHMKLEEFQKILSNLPKLKRMALHCLGEPTLNPAFLDIVEHARNSKKVDTLTFTTNLLGRDPDYYDQLFEKGLSRITVSVDSLDPTIAPHVRTGTDTAKLERRLREVAKRHPRKVKVNCVLGKENISTFHETLEIIDDIAKEAGYVINTKIENYDYHGNDIQLLNDEGVQKLMSSFEAWTKRFKNLNLIRGFFTNRKLLCDWPWRAQMVTIDGYLTACSHSRDQSSFGSGNLFEKHFHEIVDQGKGKEFLESFKTSSPDFCKKCDRDICRSKAVINDRHTIPSLNRNKDQSTAQL